MAINGSVSQCQIFFSYFLAKLYFNRVNRLGLVTHSSILNQDFVMSN